MSRHRASRHHACDVQRARRYPDGHQSARHQRVRGAPPPAQRPTHCTYSARCAVCATWTTFKGGFFRAVDPSLQDAINQLYLTSLQDLLWAKHGIHRDGRHAWLLERLRGARSPTTCSTARYLAMLRYGDQLAHDEMLKRHEIYMNPQSSSLSTALTSVGFVFYLACRRRRPSSTCRRRRWWRAGEVLDVVVVGGAHD